LKKSEVVALIFPQFEGVIDTGKTKNLLLRIGLGFRFRNACKAVFEAIAFVFVMHPFDVGD